MIKTCGECPEFNNGEPLKEGQNFAVCPYLLASRRCMKHKDQHACARYYNPRVKRVKKNTLDQPLWHLTCAPDYIPNYCVVCGKPATNKHHVIEKSDGELVEGVKIRRPLVRLCGSGTTGCHGKVHDRVLHVDWRGGEWKYLETSKPTRQIKAYELKEGWKPCK